MRNLLTLRRLRNVIGASLCFAFVLYSPMRLSVASASFHTPAVLKTESQYRSEASRYEAAIRAITPITTMRLDTPDDLAKAVAVAERELPNFKLRFSKFVVTGLSDSAFAAVVKKRISDKKAAEAFKKELNADRSALLKLDGAEALRTRIVRSAEADAALLNRVGQRLKEAAEKIKTAASGNAGLRSWPIKEDEIVNARFVVIEPPESIGLPASIALEPLSASAAVAIAVTVSLLAGFVIGYVTNDLSTVQDEEEACLQKAEDDYNSCMRAAAGLPGGFPFFLRESARAICLSKVFLDESACHLLR